MACCDHKVKDLTRKRLLRNFNEIDMDELCPECNHYAKTCLFQVIKSVRVQSRKDTKQLYDQRRSEKQFLIY